MGQTGHEIYPRISRRRSNFKCCFGRNCLGRYQDQKQDIGFFLISSTLDGVPAGLRQFCGVYTSLAADMKGYAMQIGSAKSHSQTPFRTKSRIHQLTQSNQFEIGVIRVFQHVQRRPKCSFVRLARGEVILHTLEASWVSLLFG